MTAPPVSLVVVIFAKVQPERTSEEVTWINDFSFSTSSTGVMLTPSKVRVPDVTSNRYPVRGDREKEREVNLTASSISRSSV